MGFPPSRLNFALVLLFGAMASGSAIEAADMSSRGVSQLLFKAKPGETPDLSGKDLSGLDLAGLDFKGANLAGANLYGADLSEAILAKSDLTGAKLDRATITRTDFAGAILANTTILRPSIYAELAPHVGEAPRFAQARMTGARIFGRLDFSSFEQADLTGVQFVGTDARDENSGMGLGSFRAANFNRAVLKGANFGGSNFSYSHFNGSDLRGANMRGADLTRADFRDADLTGADVTGANLDEADLSGAKGLDQLNGLSEALNVERAVR